MYCLDCKKAISKAYLAKWYSENSEIQRGKNRNRYFANRDEELQKRRDWYAANREQQAVKHREWYEANKEQTLAREKAWYEANKGRVAQLNKAWRQKNRERYVANSRRYYEATKPKRREYTRQWRKKNPEAYKESQRKQEAMRRGAGEGTLTVAQWEAIKKAYDSRCAYCGKKPKKLTQDHVIPVSKGGPHTAANVVPACGSCNSRKRDGVPPILPAVRLML